LQNEGRTRQAIACYEQALLSKPDFAEAHHNLAVLYVQRGKRSLALDHYTLLKSIDYQMARKLFQIIYQDKILKVPNED
jgi:tetratricopeptide (TPR) repeat protein